MTAAKTYDIAEGQRILSSWKEFKELINGASGSFAWNWADNTTNTFYQLITEPCLGVNNVFWMERTGSIDQTEFETVYKNNPTKLVSAYGTLAKTGSAAPGTGVLVGGKDANGNFQILATTTTGNLYTTGSHFIFNNSTTPLFITGAISTSAPLVQTVTGTVGIAGIPVITGSVFVLNQTQVNPGWVTGSATINNFPSIQTVTGAITATIAGTTVITGSVALSGISPITGAVQVVGIPTVTGSVTINNFPSVQTVTGSVGISGTPNITGSIFVLNQTQTNQGWVTGSQFVFNNNTTPLFVTEFEPPTFMVTAENIQIGNNKSMISLLNAVGSTVFVKIKTITISNVQTATVVGILAQMRLHKISAHSVGTALTPVSFDSGDSLNVAVTARTGATVTEGVFFKKQLLQTNEISGGGGTGTDTLVALLETLFPFFSEANDSKALVLRANEGIHIRQATNSTVGTFDLTIVFTVETSV